MIAIATGKTKLDELLHSEIKESQVVNYREFFTKSNFDIVIISNYLMGDISLENVFFTLKQNGTRIIYLSNEDMEEEHFNISLCFKYGVYDIFLEDCLTEKIQYLIDNPKSMQDEDIQELFVKYVNKETLEEKRTTLKGLLKGKGDNSDSKEASPEEVKVITKEKIKIKEEIKIVEKIINRTVVKTIRQQIITFYTTDDSQLTADLIADLSILLSKKSKQKILVIDMNAMFPVMDHYFNIDKNVNIQDAYSMDYTTSLVNIYNAINKNIFGPDLLSSLVIHHPKYNNLDIITGLYDLSKYEMLDLDHYSKLIEVAAENYDTVLINTNPDITMKATYIALCKARSIIALTKGNYTYARNVKFIVDNLITNQRLQKNKFNIIVSDYSKDSISKQDIEGIFKGFKIIGYIPYNSKKELMLNKRKPFITSPYAKKDLENYISVIQELGYEAKSNFFDRIKNRKNDIEEIIEKEEISTNE